MYLKISIVVILLSLHGIMGASIAVEDHDITIFPNGTVNENSTKTANSTEENVQETRAIDIVADSLKSNVSSNSTANSTSSYSIVERAIEDETITNDNSTMLNSTDSSTKNSSMIERAVEDEKLALTEESNSTKATNNSSSEVERAAVEEIGNASLLINATEINNNQTTRSVNNTSNSTTSNHWTALPYFQNMTGVKLQNSSEVSNSSSTLVSRQVDNADNKTMDNSTEKTVDLTKLDDMEVDGVSTLKPCTTVSCLISRGCSDSSCTPDDN